MRVNLFICDSAGVMYWSDSTGSTVDDLVGYIERANLDGTNRTVLRSEILAFYIAFVLQGGNIYFTDWLSS